MIVGFVKGPAVTTKSAARRDLSAENVFSPSYKTEILTKKIRSTEEQTVKFSAL